MKKGSRIFVLLLVFASLLSTLLPGVSRADEGEVRLIALNIGKADCMLLLWEDRAYLIDAGWEQTYPALEAALEQCGVTHLNGVFLTHCHKDHTGGLMPLAQSGVAVDAWYAARIYYDVKEDKHPAQLAAAVRGQEVVWLEAGDEIDAGGGAAFRILGPLTVNETNENNNSLVMRFSSPQGSILLAGDMKEDEEYELLSANAFSAADVLKVGHHGDNKATTQDMLRIVRPKASLILTSTQEEHDTPAPATLSRLAAVGSRVYVSQDARDAVMITLKNGEPTVEDVAWAGLPPRIENLKLTISLEQDLLTLQNLGQDTAILTDCYLYSSRGDERLALPKLTLAPGESYAVGSRTTTDSYDLLWDKKRVWNQKKLDLAVLYDACGRALARTDNGLEE